MLYRFEDFDLDLDARTLTKGGVARHLERQVFDVLVLLVENQHRVVTKDELIEVVWNGRIVSDAVLSTRINSLRKALDDDGRAQRLIKTHTRTGFRFVGEAQRPNAATKAVASPDTDDRPSLAVLPFENLSGGDHDDTRFLGDGITQEIVSVLSKSRWLFLLAAESSLTLRDASSDPRSAAQALSVRYLLKGSYQMHGDQIRLNVALIDGQTGGTLSTYRHHGKTLDPFELIDTVAWAAVGELLPDITLQEQQRSRRVSPGRLDIWTRYLRALEALRAHNASACAEAVEILQAVLEDRPDFAVAHARLATGYLHQGLFGWSPLPREELFEKAQHHARTGYALDASEALTCDALASAAQFAGDLPEAENWARKAIDLNPTCVAAYGTLTTALAMRGDAQGALDVYAQLARVSPRDPDAASAVMGATIAHFSLNAFDEAAKAARHHAALRPNWYGNKTFLAASLAHMGDLAGASEAVASLTEQFPGYSVERHRQNTLLRTQADVEKLLDGLRLAGLPETSSRVALKEVGR